MRAFRRTPRGVEAWLDASERALLRELAGQLVSLLDDDTSDPALSRLLPDAYRQDAEAAQEFRSLTESDLRHTKRAAARTLGEVDPAAGTLVLDEETAEQWLLALNDLRLALGVRLHVTETTFLELEELDEDELDPDRLQGLAVYDLLTWMQGSLVEAVAGA